MGALAVLFLVLAVLCGIGNLVCFILVLIQMFKHDQTGLGIACIVLAFCTGIGTLIAFIYGWIKSGEWDLKKVMLAWTGCLVGNLLCWVIVVALRLGAAATPMQMQMENEETAPISVEY